MPFLPLAGVRVVDVTTSYAGPYCTQLLAAFGADVVKIEPPAGDEARTWGPPFVDRESALFLAANAGKRSLALDLRRGGDVARRLVEQADVFVQSLRPGLADELGLGADALRSTNERLVYCAISSYGPVGPKRLLPGYDPLAQAAGGIISVTGEPGRDPVRVGVSLIDQGTGCWAALAILGALLERATSGAGRTIDVSLYETALAYVGYHLIGFLGSGREPTPQGTAFPSIAPYQVLRARDGGLMIAAGNDRLFRSLCAALGVHALADDARFLTNPDRAAHRAELATALEERLREEDRAVWLERLTDAGVPVAPVATMADIATDPQTEALEILRQLDGRTLLAPPLSLDGERPAHASAPPALGAHTREVLADAGFEAAEIDELAAAGVIVLG